MPPRSKVPACTQKYHPSTGGYNGGYIEGKGMPGDKGEGGFSTPTGNTVDGDFNHEKVASHGNYPHSPADPAVGGPPLGSTSGPQGAVNQ